MASKVFIERSNKPRPVLLDNQTYYGVAVDLHDDTAKRALEFAEKVREFEEWLRGLTGSPNDTVACPKFLREVKKSAKSNTRKKVSKSAGSGRSKKSTEQ